MGLVRMRQVAQHAQAEVLRVPSGKGEGIGDVKGEMFDGHEGGEEKEARLMRGSGAGVCSVAVVEQSGNPRVRIRLQCDGFCRRA